VSERDTHTTDNLLDIVRIGRGDRAAVDAAARRLLGRRAGRVRQRRRADAFRTFEGRGDAVASPNGRIGHRSRARVMASDASGQIERASVENVP
jgi:hypothetical protein